MSYRDIYCLPHLVPGMRTLARTMIAAICIPLFSLPACAHDSEPINTDFASPLARRTANLNFDLQHFRKAADEDLAGVDFEYGIARRMQFSAGIPLARHMSGSGESVIGAGSLSLAWRYLIAGGNEKPFAISINPEAEFPTGNPSAAGRAYGLGASINVDAHHGDRLWFHSNWGYATPVAHFDEKEKDFNYAAAGMYELTEKWHSVLEVFGQHDFNSAVTQTFIALEMIYSLGEHWEMKAALPVGVTSSAPSVGVQFRLTWKIGPSERQ